MSAADNHEIAIETLERSEKAYEFFCRRIQALLEGNPELDMEGLNCVHSIRFRKKVGQALKTSVSGKKRREFLLMVKTATRKSKTTLV